ncbi:FHA domain-containing protein [Agromyces sp. ZXT2-6]|uniref:FHA domain-containing protein n=1 Tax=Agromyces sp. ZXT2-6 TaxID=3461153 RepID=UPI004054A89C
MADYRPDPGGAWVAALRAGTVLVLPAARTDDLVALWPGLGSADAAARVIDRLTAGGVASAPGFALVVRERSAASVRVVVRGPLTVRVDGDAVSGSGVSTWSERVFAGATSVAVAVDGAADAAGPRLPIVEGVVPASVLEWSPAAADATGAAATAPGIAPDRPFPAAGADPEEAGRPAEQTMVSVEDTVVGFSRTERPRIDAADAITPALSGIGAAPAAGAVASTTTIIPPRAPADGAVLGDHDGLTVAASDLRRLREARDAGRVGSASGPDGVRADDRLALRMPDGSFEPIAGELLLGRAPVIGRVAGSRMPRPVVIGAGDPDISRTHLRVAVEGGTAVVTDLESRNGTQVVAPGRAPMRLRPAEPTPVLPETVIDLGGGWTIQVVVR